MLQLVFPDYMFALQSRGLLMSLGTVGARVGEVTVAALTGLALDVSTASIGSLKRTSSQPYALGVNLITVCSGILMYGSYPIRQYYFVDWVQKNIITSSVLKSWLEHISVSAQEADGIVTLTSMHINIEEQPVFTNQSWVTCNNT